MFKDAQTWIAVGISQGLLAKSHLVQGTTFAVEWKVCLCFLQVMVEAPFSRTMSAAQYRLTTALLDSTVKMQYVPLENNSCRASQVALVSWGTKILCIGGGLVESDDDSRDFHLNLFRVVPFLKSILGNDTQDEYAPLKFLDD